MGTLPKRKRRTTLSVRESNVTKRADGKTKSSRWRKSIRRIGLLVVIMAVGLVIFHHPLLHLCSSILIYSDSTTNADFAIVAGGGDCFNAAVNAVKKDRVDKILLYKRHPPRLEMIGLLPNITTLQIIELERHHIKPEKIRLLAMQPQGQEDPLSIPGNYLRTRPQKSAIVFCDELKSREIALVLDRLFEEAIRKRIHVVAVASESIHSDNWWKSTAGLREYFDRLFNLSTRYLYPNSTKSWKVRTFDEFRDSAVSDENS